MIIKNVYKHFIINKGKSNSKILIKPLITLVVLMLSIVYAGYISYDVSQYINCFLYPETKLFNDTENVTFVSNFLQKELKVILPVKCSNYEIDNGTIRMQVQDNIMLVAPENCVVYQIETSLNYSKRITLILNQSVTCTIDNLNVIGVKVGDNVKKGADIATLYANSVVSMCLFSNGEQIKDLTISKGCVSWTN